jgi:flagellar motor switch protein FliM
MSLRDKAQVEELLKGYSSKQVAQQKAKTKTISPCNFRSAGRLSNENVRLMTAVHDTLARHLASALDVYLGTVLEVKLQTIDQAPSKEYIAAISAMSYLAPFGFDGIQSTMLVECDIALVFPVIELLLGGSGADPGDARDLSEIEEEIMHEVMAVIARQAEHTWKFPAGSLTLNRRAKISGLHQYCPPGERVTYIAFDVEVAGHRGTLKFLFPTSFVNALVKQLKLDQPQKKNRFRFFPSQGIRDRILDCDTVVASELPGAKVVVRDLIALQPGSVLKLRAPVKSPGVLTIGSQPIFESYPVRDGLQKAAQLGQRIPVTRWKREL